MKKFSFQTRHCHTAMALNWCYVAQPSKTPFHRWILAVPPELSRILEARGTRIKNIEAKNEGTRSSPFRSLNTSVNSKLEQRKINSSRGQYKSFGWEERRHFANLFHEKINGFADFSTLHASSSPPTYRLNDISEELLISALKIIV